MNSADSSGLPKGFPPPIPNLTGPDNHVLHLSASGGVVSANTTSIDSTSIENIATSGRGFIADIIGELSSSAELLFNNKLNWLLLLGPVALVGDYMGWLGEAACFAFSGIALIPCAER
jgi:hypothetical protein